REGEAMVRIDGQGNGNNLIRARGLGKTYQRGGEAIHVLQGLNLDVDAGDFVAFMGPSGSGKPTLLNLLGGLDVPTAGSVTVAGASRGVRLPDVQPDSRPHRFPERRTPAAADPSVEGGAPAAPGDGARGRGPGRPHAPLSAAALRRAGAARGHRARHRGRSDLSALRRADGRSRPEERGRDPGPRRPARDGARQDRADGDPRPAGGGARARRPAPGKGRARGHRDGGPGAMKYLPLVLTNLFRKKTRTALTAGSFAVALFLFGILTVVDGAF